MLHVPAYGELTPPGIELTPLSFLEEWYTLDPMSRERWEGPPWSGSGVANTKFGKKEKSVGLGQRSQQGL